MPLETRTAQKDKFDQLLKKSISTKCDNCWVVNLSSKELSPNEEAVQKKGMNFAVTPEQIPVNDIIVGVEGGLQGLTGSDVDKACLKIAGVLTSAKPPPSNLPWSLWKALDDLKAVLLLSCYGAPVAHCHWVLEQIKIVQCASQN